jgi:cytoskeletal protein RodZ
MRDADRTIERLLAGLRDAEPSAGIERRIIEATAARKLESSASLWPSLTLPWLLRPETALSLACAVILAGSLIVLTVHQHRHAPADVRNHAASADARQATEPETVAHKASIAPRRNASRVKVRPTHTPDVSAVEETQTASFPAPPLPLTEQEKLLLRLAHGNDARDMTILNPDVQADQSAKATEQFQQFFGMNATEMRSQLE